ncbi:MAG: CoA-binding protein [bacterium]
MPIDDKETLKEILLQTKTIAIVGVSPKPWRDSGAIASHLQARGYTIFPVNPNYDEVNGARCYPDLRSIPEQVDLVDIFRRSEEVMPIVEEAIKIGAKTIWMQLEVVNHEAAKKAEEAGLNVVMNLCIAVEHRRLIR